MGRVGNAHPTCLLIISTTFIGVNLISLKSTQAIKISNEQKAFVIAPRLIPTAANFRQKNSPVTRYLFTIEVPENAGESLKAIRVTQKENVDTVIFNKNKTRAVEGNNMRGIEIPLAAIEEESQPGETTVVFNTPIEPGNTVTISVKPKRNPSVGGVYLFGITAYPTGDNSRETYLGSGRIHINQ
jgi:hypothetical protein